MAHLQNRLATNFVEKRLIDKDEQTRLTALRALLANNKLDHIKYFDTASQDKLITCLKKWG